MSLLSIVSFLCRGSRGSAVCTATGYGLDDRGVGVLVSVDSRIFTFLRRPDQLWNPPSLLTDGLGALSPVVKRLGREADLQLVPRSRKCESIHLLVK
jgi:hypothetical protein